MPDLAHPTTPATSAGVISMDRRSQDCSVLTYQLDNSTTRAWAERAAAQLRPGDRFYAGVRPINVLSASDTQVRYACGPGIKRTATIGGPGWLAFIGLLGDCLLAEAIHSTHRAAIEEQPVTRILLRDRAVIIDAAGMLQVL